MTPSQPRIPNLPMNTADWILEILAASGVLLLIATFAYFMPRLPPTIPTHFGLDGVPDAVGDRRTFVALPAVAMGVYAILTVVARRPNWLNYPHRITTENASESYRWMRRFMALLKTEIVWMLGLISLQMGRIALGNAEQLPGGIVPFLVLIPGTAIGYMILAKRRWGVAERRKP